MPARSLRIRVLSAIDEVSKGAWDGLLGAEALPFTRWDWIHALEASGSASARTGWQPHHLTAWRGGALVGAAPAWIKAHSMGEHVYDFAWAAAAESLGVRYYPKLLLGIPLSPITSPRFLVAPGEKRARVRELLLEAAIDLAREEGCSSVHVIFPEAEEADALEAAGLARRAGMQYHWKNPGYASYEEYLARFGSKRRTQLRRERAEAAQQGISIKTLRRGELDEGRATLAWKFYAATCRKFAWGAVQLNREFFGRLLESMPESIEMVEAVREGEVIGGAFNVATKDQLFGRYWGCFEKHRFLHFNVCLYHSIDECIRLGRRVFSPGAGGEHKIARGFEPTAIHSAHRIFDARLDRAVRAFVARERETLAPYFEAASVVAGMKAWEAAR